MNPAVAAKNIAESVLDFIFPPVCLLCEERILDAAEMICSGCFNGIPKNHAAVLTSADRKLKTKQYFSFVAWRFEYSEEMRTVIHRMKFHEYRNLAYRLGEEMAVTLDNRAELKRADFIIPVPLHRARHRDRGYNQSALLGERISKLSGIPYADVLVRTKNNPPQSTRISSDERLRNVKNIFRLKEGAGITRKRIILIDDVVTSGATVNECAKTLEKGGAHEVMVLAAAYANP